MYSPVTRQSPRLSDYARAREQAQEQQQARGKARSGSLGQESELVPLREGRGGGYGAGRDVVALDLDKPSGPPKPSKAWACVPIVVNQFFERLAFYGLQGNMALFLTRELHLSSGVTDAQLGLWQGVCYLTPLIGGYVADSYLGRWRAILVFLGVYLVGFVGVAAAAFATGDDGLDPGAVFFPAAYVIAFGMGAMKPLVSTFGADQLDADDPVDAEPEDEEFKDSYFSAVYWFQNLGAFMAFTVLVYLCQNVSFQVGFTVALASLGVALLVLLAGTRRYRFVPPQGSPFKIICSVLGEALCPPSPAQHAAATDGGGALAAALMSHGGTHTDEEVDMVKSVGRLLPVFALLVVYWGINGQMSTTFFNQGCQMNLTVGSFVVPVAALGLFNTAIIIILVPVFDQLIYPGLKRCGVPTSTLHKMGYGMALEVFVMVAAAALEIQRREVVDEGRLVGPSVCFSGEDDSPHAADLSIFWQAPLFVGMGISEILTSIPAMDFFYSEAPTPMKSACAALELLTVCFGQWLMAGLIPLVNADPDDPWIPSDLNEGHLAKFFLLLAALVTLNLVAFVGVSRQFLANASTIAAGEQS